jgi:phosphatidylglycerophosphate synthase
MAGPVPDIRTLRTICHSGKLSRDRRPWYVLQRRATIYLTWLVLHTGLEANHVTMITVLLALAGSVLLAMSSAKLALLGALVLAAHHVLDKVDGDVARFRGRHSIVGVYLDDLGHSVAFAGLFLGLGVHLAHGAPSPRAALIPVLAGAVGALSMVMGRAQKSVGFQLYAQHVMGRPELMPPPESESRWHVLSRGAAHRDRGEEEGVAPENHSFASWLRDVVLQLSDFSVMLVMVLALVFAEYLGAGQVPLRILLYAASAFHVAVLAGVIAINVTVNVESEVRRLDREAREGTHDEP